MVTGALTKILGAQVLRDVQTFVSALDTMFGGFRERADHTYQLLQAPGTAFLVVAAPEPDALREASYFVERLAQERMPLAGLMLNRVQPVARPPGCPPPAAWRAAETLTAAGSHPLTAAACGCTPSGCSRSSAERRLARAFHRGAPGRAGRRGAGPARGRA